MINRKRARGVAQGPSRMYDDRKARKQADRMEDDGMEQGSGFNIWYGPRKKKRGMNPASSRCNPSTDAGVTRGSEAGAREFCIFFARGSCAKGFRCHKLHFLPSEADDAAQDNAHDCFGRQRVASDEDDDRDGVGCFLKENRTLWVGGAPVGAGAAEAIQQNFEVWGHVASVRVVENKACAFVQYSLRASAEFAKEAMGNQSLLDNPRLLGTSDGGGGSRSLGLVDGSSGGRRGGTGGGAWARKTGGGRGGGGGGAVLHVRWASEDPNPRAVDKALTRHAQSLLASQVATGSIPEDLVGWPLGGADRALLKKCRLDPSNPSPV
ncbi:unnamed protein product, partial [Discosporangium mesarthrocarpum]